MFAFVFFSFLDFTFKVFFRDMSRDRAPSLPCPDHAAAQLQKCTPTKQLTPPRTCLPALLANSAASLGRMPAAYIKSQEAT